MESDFIIRFLINFLIVLPCIVIGFTVHEFSHAYSDYLLGDPTAKYEGRLSLNPLKHIDPVGTSLLLITTLFMGMSFGWAKPVPYNPYNYKNAQDGTLISSFAGPASNLILAALAGLLFRLGIVHPSEDLLANILYQFASVFVSINIWLAVFNLIPVAPLDGSKILYGLLPTEMAYKYAIFERKYQFFLPMILVILMASGMLGSVIGPFHSFLFRLLTGSSF